MSWQAVVDLAKSVYAEFDNARAKLPPLMPDLDGVPHPIACKAGCNFCCRLEVAVSAAEVLAIKHYLETTGKSALEKIKTRLRHTRREIGDKVLSDRKASGVMCPLLAADGNCSVYPVRPLACRAWLSIDVARCREDAENPLAGVHLVQSGGLRQFRGQLTSHLNERAAAMGVRPGSYELVRALHIAWQTPNFEARCTANEPVLAGATFKYRP